MQDQLKYKSPENTIKNHPNLPEHIAIIMDGNGRWAKKRRLPRIAGHNQGIESVREIVEACGELGIKVLTLYTFSRENWKRPGWETSALMDLLLVTVKRELKTLMEKNVRIRTIGELNDLPEKTRQAMKVAIKRTAKNTGLILNLALSYGGRTEIRDAIIAISDQVKEGNVKPEQIDENLINKYLQTNGLPDPDLIIRTSGENRISNFLLWQMAYSEIYITKTNWPDFRKPELIEALNDYLNRERRFGMVRNQPLTLEVGPDKK